MTLDDLEAALPNGLHDAEIHSIAIDYVARTARFILDAWVGTMDMPAGPERERYRRASLELTGLQYLAIQPPDFRPQYHFADTAPVKTGGLSPVDVPSPLPEDAFEAELFIADWNSFIQVAATDARLTWLD